MAIPEDFNLSCPIPIHDYPQVLLAHGSGGRLMHDLLEKMIQPTFSKGRPTVSHDSIVFPAPGQRLAFTTDSYVVHPLFFPGGDIGSLAVHGTVNDLAMSGARPLYLSCGLIIEEGLPMETLWRVVRSMQAAAEQAKVSIITGDTKVVNKGKGDGVFINTAGIGVVEHELKIHPGSIKAGDAIILNGDIGRHGMAIMAKREGLEFESEIESDSAALAAMVLDVIGQGVEVHCLRDTTRGGLATTLNELARAAGVGVFIEESKIPVLDQVHGACEMLGFDPLHVACEGRCVFFVPAKAAAKTVEILRQHPEGAGACIIGEVRREASGYVTMKSQIGVERIVDMLTGEQLPRIC